MKGKPETTGKVIGLTGGIASGKTSAAKILESMGCIVLDADKIGHDTYRKGQIAHSKIIAAFGNSVLANDGEIDRKKLGQIVFSDDLKLGMLCDIVWPEIKRQSKKLINQLREDKPQTNIILEAAVLLEAGWECICDEVWVIYVAPDIAIKRLQERNQLSPDEAKKRLQAQLPNSERLKKADRFYENKGSINELKNELKKMLGATSSISG